MLHVFFSLRRSQQPELPPPSYYTLPLCRPAFCVNLHKHPLGSRQSVDTLWLIAGAHSVLEVANWAARTSEYRLLLARLPPPPSAPAVAPTLWTTGAPAFSAADGRPSERRPSAPPPPSRTRSTTAAAGSGSRWDAAVGPRHPATAAEVAAGGALPTEGGDRCEGNGPGGSSSCASASGTGGGCASRQRSPRSRRSAAALRRRHRDAAAALKAPASAGPSRRSSSDAAWRVARAASLSSAERPRRDGRGPHFLLILSVGGSDVPIPAKQASCILS